MQVPLPTDWPELTKLAYLQAIALAHRALTYTRALAENSRLPRVRLAAENARLQSEVAMLKEEMRLKDARMASIEARRRPRYTPVQRFAILALKAPRHWNASECARHFQLTAFTIAKWVREAGKAEDGPLLDHGPVNRYPDFVARLVHELKRLFPSMGRRRIADTLCRAGLHLASSTVKRMLDKPVPKPPTLPMPPVAASSRGPLKSKRPNDIWHVDLTVAPTLLGWWTPWFPRSLVPLWPFCWWVVVVMDHKSRRALELRAFRQQPSAEQVLGVLDAAVVENGRPRDIVTDQGSQFQKLYRAWCKARGIRYRYGAIGKHGSIAVIERFIRSLKYEHLKLRALPLANAPMQAALTLYGDWYNEHRPHQGLKGATPNEIYFQRQPARDGPRFEPRPRLRADALEPRASLHVVTVEGHPHLPVVELKTAA